ncbi:hypothetical protein Rsub_07492 [Raphidocelis subcapitata]|uniref:Rhodanese domain-containing protein n=1 Tax=Raphidocelis subcapitata TaxID=307507 RepID=A0A2V0P532_9CHLO|nr:hypothetical protein Rsub_07492 [Raphidocelis subcapitata]|eukprot:GBF94991.1 hypothetical protein Rsub_07492 [Raphidocelis subcapitata]
MQQLQSRSRLAGRGPAAAARGRRAAPVAVGASSGNDGAAAGRGGPTGLDVSGHRPTSPAGWELMKQALVSAGVKVISPQEVVFALGSGGAALIDVRPAALFAEGAVEGAVNCEYFRSIQGWSPWQVARRIGYAAFGVLNGTEVNPDFSAEVEAAVGGDRSRPVVLYCSQGGSLESGGGQRKGFQTRSLVAAYELVQRGFTSVSVMKGGFAEWSKSGRDVAVPGGGGGGGDGGSAAAAGPAAGRQ